MISINATEAKALSTPSLIEELTRYEIEVTEAIKEAATAGIKEIVLRVPNSLCDSIAAQLKELGYSYYIIGAERQMNFLKINWK